jgi:hypothetical protein
VCDGDGIASGACDCDGNVLDCNQVCGGDGQEDECGVCGGDGSSCEELSASIAVSGFSFDYYEDNQEEVGDSLLEDLAVFSGNIDPSAISIKSVSQGSLLVNFTISDGGFSGLNLTRVKQVMTGILEGNTDFEFDSLNRLVLRNPNALEGSGLSLDRLRSRINSMGPPGIFTGALSALHL